MSHHIPFDIQTEIVKRISVTPLIRFRMVSKQWKSLIESDEFINDQKRINNNRSQCYLLVRHKLNLTQYTSIIDDDTFPNREFSLTLLPPLISLPYLSRKLLSSVNGLSCFYGVHSELRQWMAVLWNPIIRKSVGIVIPSLSNNELNNDFVIGFGFCSDTSDPKIVKLNRYYYKEREVMVFTLSSRIWKSVSNVPPALGQVRLDRNQVCIKGCSYWCALDAKTNVIVSFDLESEKFGLVRGLPECLLKTNFWKVAEVNESLGVLADDYYDDQGRCLYDDEDRVCGVWVMDVVTKSFTKMFTIKQPRGKWPFHGVHGVLGFRKNGEVIIEAREHCRKKSRLEVYEPSSGCIHDIGING